MVPTGGPDGAARAPGENRTPDALLRTEALYPLSYGGGPGQPSAGRTTVEGMTDQAATPGGPRRRRRAVGPAGARVAEQVDRALLAVGPAQDTPAPDDEERLRADVPPHHGS